MKRLLSLIALMCCLSFATRTLPARLDKEKPEKSTLEVGFGEVDISPLVAVKPVYMAGFGQNRKATRLHDPLFARAVVLKDGTKKIALVSVDLVGFFHANVKNVRKQLPGFDYVLVSSTHTHEGPDTMGLWGPSPFKSGVDPDYLRSVEENIARAVQQAETACRPARVRIGTARLPELLHDSREPFVKHDELVVLQFISEKEDKSLGVLVQWNNHPETLDPKSTEISADYVGVVVERLGRKYQCPAAYFTGTVGGLMTTMHVDVMDKDGKKLPEGTWEKTVRYGELLAGHVEKVLEKAQPLELTPFVIRSRGVYLPMENPLYLLGRQLGVLQRDAYYWTGDPSKAEPAPVDTKDKPLALLSEISYLRLGELEIAAIPGEIYPELVLGKVQDPADPAADFPEAPIEPSIYAQLKSKHRMILGLANDEIGYILPKRQWDEKPPFCYGRKKAQYGEKNSIGPEAGPILCKAFAELVKAK